ncbi:MAG: TlpA family protein disulfide reductase [Anaerolineae bacterium]|nr:TlpA family protein disulfide reductase [Anaerolineae bacterium]
MKVSCRFPLPFKRAFFALALLILMGCRSTDAAPVIPTAIRPEPAQTATHTPLPAVIRTVAQPAESMNTSEDSLIVFDYQVVDGSGTPLDWSEFEGKPLLLIFFSIHCGHCHNEAQHLEELNELYSDRINLLALEVSGAETEEVQQFAEEYGLTFPVRQDTSLELTRAAGITGVPTNLLVDSDGTLYNSLRGYRSQEDFITAIDAFLEAQGGRD